MSKQLTEFAILDDLIDQYCAGMIRREGFETLQAMLRERSDYRSRYRQIINVHIALHESTDVGELSSLLGTDFPSPSLRGENSSEDNSADKSQRVSLSPSATFSSSQPTSSSQPWVMAAVLTISAGLLMMVGYWLRSTVPFGSFGFGHGRPLAKASSPENSATQGETITNVNSKDSITIPRNTAFEGISDRVMMLQSSAGAVWAGSGNPMRVGDLLPARVIEIESGMIELVFVSGAVAVIEGPAKLEVTSPLHGILHSGKIRCFVPESASGFVIEASGTRYLDLGTEFGLEVQPGGQQELHVFDGEVAVSSLSGSRSSQLIRSGNGLRSNPDQQWTPIPSDSPRFADSLRIHERKQQQEAKRHEAWLRHIEDLRQDPDLVVLYDFQPNGKHPSQLIDRSASEDHGGIIGCQWSNGRWDGKQALEFKRPNDRVRLSIPGTFKNLTFSAWLRVDGFDREFNSIILTNQFQRGDIHWQVRSFGAIDAGIKLFPSKRQVIHLTPPVLGYNDLGHWVHLVLVVDQNQRTASHILNGVLVNSKSLNQPSPDSPPREFDLRIGKAELGNWSPDRKLDNWPIRNLNGRMDEFAIFKRALTGQEIQQLYDAGKPAG